MGIRNGLRTVVLAESLSLHDRHHCASSNADDRNARSELSKMISVSSALLRQLQDRKSRNSKNLSRERCSTVFEKSLESLLVVMSNLMFRQYIRQLI
jgi:hypothetical protein